MCADYHGGRLRFTVKTREAYHPLADPAWQTGLNHVAVSFYDDFGNFLSVASLFAVDGRWEPEIIREGELVCRFAGGYSSREGIVLDGIDPGCVGTGDPANYSVSAYYDVDGDDFTESDAGFDCYPNGGEDFDFIILPAENRLARARIAGGDRFSTSVAVSRTGFPGGAERVYVARADQFADALAAGAVTEGPLLLSPTCGPPPATVVDEVARLDPETVTVLGGPGAVCGATAGTIAGGRPVERLAGEDRFATAAVVSRHVFPDPQALRERIALNQVHAYLARADDPADALAGGQLTHGPVLLVPSCGALPGAVADELARIGPDLVTALGGGAAVCPELLSAAAAAAGWAGENRYAGSDRFATARAIAVAQDAARPRPPVVYLANALSPADAVVSGPLQDAQLLLVPGCGIEPQPVREHLARLASGGHRPGVVALGGDGAICEQMLLNVASTPVS